MGLSSLICLMRYAFSSFNRGGGGGGDFLGKGGGGPGKERGVFVFPLDMIILRLYGLELLTQLRYSFP